MAAAVLAAPSPQPSLNMSTHRPPLANVPNATNSPHRPPGLVPAKRSRATTGTQIEIPYGQPPPKKHLIDPSAEQHQQDGRSPTRLARATAGGGGGGGADSRLFMRRPTHSQPTAFEKKLVAVRDRERQSQQRGTRLDRNSTETLDSIRQWQRHYRKAFPQFVFYFDSISGDVRNKCSRQVVALGAREEKFFSRLVTHVVTSRPIPPDTTATTSPNDLNPMNSVDQAGASGSVQTVNPSLLERNAEAAFQLPFKHDARREPGNLDVLHRARQMGMKIWALEKLQRMIATINDGELGGHSHVTRSHNAGGAGARIRGDNDLSEVLKNELLNGPSDRESVFSAREMVVFKGPFVYVHDMDERTRPVMVREYARVVRRQDGAWPQFRSAPLGKCPFLEEPPSKKEMERRRVYEEKMERAKNLPPFQRAMAIMKLRNEDSREQRRTKEAAEAEAEAAKAAKASRAAKAAGGVTDMERSPARTCQEEVPTQQVEAQLTLSATPTSPRKSSESFIPPPIPRTGSFYTGREPAASGVQPSNITSAIRSQMISSTAAGPGAKAGISKEVHELKRKVLEKSNGMYPAGTVPPTDVSATLRNSRNQGNRQIKPVAAEKRAPRVNDEESAPLHQNGTLKQRTSNRTAAAGALASKKENKRDPKPGYCENCRDKFDDFEEHVLTRKHRKFATDGTNWEALDLLLRELRRPHRREPIVDEPLFG